MRSMRMVGKEYEPRDPERSLAVMGILDLDRRTLAASMSRAQSRAALRSTGDKAHASTQRLEARRASTVSGNDNADPAG
jgi:hypothetical protein